MAHQDMHQDIMKNCMILNHSFHSDITRINKTKNLYFCNMSLKFIPASESPVIDVFPQFYLPLFNDLLTYKLDIININKVIIIAAAEPYPTLSPFTPYW